MDEQIAPSQTQKQKWSTRGLSWLEQSTSRVDKKTWRHFPSIQRQSKKVKAWMKLNLVKNKTKKGFYKYLSGKGKARENAGLFDGRPGNTWHEKRPSPRN